MAPRRRYCALHPVHYVYQYLATAEPTDVFVDCVAMSQNELQKRFKPSITKATARLTLTQVPEVQFNSQALMRATPSYETKHPGERSG